MQIFDWNDCLTKNPALLKMCKNGSALTIGGFDGPHIGHKSLFDKIFEFKNKNAKNGIVAGCVTFNFPPKAIKNPAKFGGEISSVNLKTEYLAKTGFDFVLLIDFSDEFSKIVGTDFLSILKESCSMQFLVAGLDFRCGYKLDTGIAQITDFATKNGFQFCVVNDCLYKGIRVSSTIIRQFVQQGDLQTVNLLLGRPYALDCKSIEYENKKTSQLQIANSCVNQVLPPIGKYKVLVTLADTSTFFSVMYVEQSGLKVSIPLEQSFQKIWKIELIINKE